ncbi:MAG: LysM peptidoglycan-binding domain-containing protein, partial [Desulfobacteraceae bacterium]|nr:LysM peptidoglycan-binding domain-containing protein [Desulfobacteraceae bacterium]
KTKKNTITGTIKVEAEETLGHYAEWLEITTKKLRNLNNLPYGKTISISQTIKIPLLNVTPTQFEERRYEYHKELTEDFFAAYAIEEIQTYDIKNGDNIWRLCVNNFEIPFWLVKKYNSEINFNTLQPMQKIKYPVVNKI